jgi:hypothetical protein
VAIPYNKNLKHNRNEIGTFLMVERNRLIRNMIQINENFHAARQEIMDKHPNFDKIGIHGLLP